MATSHKNYGPTPEQYRNICRLTHQYECGLVCDTLLQRLGDDGKYWRHIYKSLLLIYYIIINGTPEAVERFKRRQIEIKTLHSFQKIKESTGQDVGINVRERSKAITDLLSDDEALETKRSMSEKEKQNIFGEAYSSDYKTSMTETHETRKKVELKSIVLKENVSGESESSSESLDKPEVSPRYQQTHKNVFDMLEEQPRNGNTTIVPEKKSNTISQQTKTEPILTSQTNTNQNLNIFDLLGGCSSTITIQQPQNTQSYQQQPQNIQSYQQPVDPFASFDNSNIATPIVLPTQQQPKSNNEFVFNDESLNEKKSWKTGIDINSLTLDSLQVKSKEQKQTQPQVKKTLGQL
ncbi:ENTH domain containing protein, putative [Entamoeba histolytica HM-1:IMSS-B]|uniref:ENTH domain protein, putative n=6 Tax=Entamoeba histolytica TaxID=5759 RepID=C4M116_ENTH1|nr:ENTH domain protein, putative [Entamoeba histolytica HM-1:IMSS]EAL48532.1 ENTH domain protein, putative [Entamoeba histolytica HM-1:IMSS]EMD43844.1 ENTH domain containing protein [Entamoeba histolytica KU27]EMH77022.1 ENTH domain containing protein, putative [Entamoeba histolytica HM-1:IMSS-B]ENY63570.1 ENTH domain containing protein [Entamoeba histolytica HM-1:IMSS-A]|eukprot:XP_653919.1 ENTH domain protein, putative [Entamoeba histolytica HM-1:IMSS]